MALPTDVTEAVAVAIDAAVVAVAIETIVRVARISRQTGGKKIASKITVDGPSPLPTGDSQTTPSRTRRL
jgi:hypothetical protein